MELFSFILQKITYNFFKIFVYNLSNSVQMCNKGSFLPRSLPTLHPPSRPINQSINQSIMQSINQPLKQSMN